MKREVRLLEPALQDLEQIADWIAADAPQRALRWAATVEKRLQALAANPSLGFLPKDPRLSGLGYRILVLDDYLAFYVAGSKTVMVHRILHGSRDYLAVVKN